MEYSLWTIQANIKWWYESKQKITIARDYLIPKIEANINFGKDEIIIPDETITHICNTFTEQEKGVRNLKRCLEIIYTKLNLYRLMKPDSKLFEKEKTIKQLCKEHQEA